MAEKYRKLGARIWRDEKFATLNCDQKLVAIYCLTAQVNRCGIFAFSPAMAAEELGVSTGDFARDFAAVVSALGWKWDAVRRVLFFPRWWKYNTPQNVNVLKGSLSDLASLPECDLLETFWNNTIDLESCYLETFLNAMPKRCRNVPETLWGSAPIQETQTYQETQTQTQTQTETGRSEEVDLDDPLKAREKIRKDFEAAWNAAGLQKLDRLTRGLWTKLEGLMLDPTWRATWREALTRAGQSPFLARGEGSRSGPMDPSQFLRDDDFAASILRGKFDSRAGPEAATGRSKSQLEGDRIMAEAYRKRGLPVPAELGGA